MPSLLIDGLLTEQIIAVCARQAQSESDAKYFDAISSQDLSADEQASVRQGLLKAYRWQYIVSGAVHPKLQEVLGSLVSDAQATRIGNAME